MISTAKRYIILTDEEFSATTKDKITAHLQKQGMNIWHWISNAWLVIDEKGETQSKQLREELYNIAKTGSLLIFEIDTPTKCTGVTSKTQSEWILKHWIDNTPKF